jgi:hypothetical protein
VNTLITGYSCGAAPRARPEPAQDNGSVRWLGLGQEFTSKREINGLFDAQWK